MTKDQLRKAYMLKRAALSPQEAGKLEDLMLIQFQALSVEIPNVILSYKGSDKLNEYDPSLVDRYCNFRNPFGIISYPLIDKNNTFYAVAATDETIFSVNMFGIEEPADGKKIDPWDIEMIFIPLIAFDNNGYRVGYGKGYYDRFLTTCREDVLKIGFSYFQAENLIEDLHPHDVPLDLCITPEKVYSFVK